MKIIGYGICGPGEARRYMRATLEDFKRLCDEVFILVNAPFTNDVDEEIELIKEFGFKWDFDNREWGTNQWRIKEDFVRNLGVSGAAKVGDAMLCLDMDERPDETLTRQGIVDLIAKADSFVLFIVNLWDEGWNQELSFWNVRLWKWNGNVEWEHKPLHCGLAPLWARQFVNHAPHLLLHYGLKDKADRQKKWERYQKYDPHRAYLKGNYYDQLRWDKAKPLDIVKLRAILKTEVESYKEKRKEVRGIMTREFVYLRRLKDGATIDVPKADLGFYMDRLPKEFEMIADAPATPASKPPEANPLACTLCEYVGENEADLQQHKESTHQSNSGSTEQGGTQAAEDNGAQAAVKPAKKKAPAKKAAAPKKKK